MGENSEQPKMLPSPEEKKEKKNILFVTIDLEELVKFPKPIVPENQRIWQTKEDMSPDYIKLNQTLQMLSLHIARCCNEGPEVKDNINKRLVLVSTVIRIIIENLNISGYDCYGLLTEILQDIHLKIGGRKQIEKILEDIKEEEEHLSQEKVKDYMR